MTDVLVRCRPEGIPSQGQAPPPRNNQPPTISKSKNDFDDLPKNVRKMIWSFAIRNAHPEGFTLIPMHKISIVAHLNSEIRQEALSIYFAETTFVFDIMAPFRSKSNYTCPVIIKFPFDILGPISKLVRFRNVGLMIHDQRLFSKHTAEGDETYGRHVAFPAAEWNGKELDWNDLDGPRYEEVIEKGLVIYKQQMDDVRDHVSFEIEEMAARYGFNGFTVQDMFNLQRGLGDEDEDEDEDETEDEDEDEDEDGAEGGVEGEAEEGNGDVDEDEFEDKIED